MVVYRVAVLDLVHHMLIYMFHLVLIYMTDSASLIGLSPLSQRSRKGLHAALRLSEL